MSSGSSKPSSYASPEATAGWRQGAAERAQYLGPITDRMLDLAGVRPGSRVLDIAAGTGEQTIEAALRVGSEGYVLATDVAERMLEVAAAAVREAGLTRVQTRVLDARELDLPEASFDAAICRLSLMLLPERRRVLDGIRRALVPGARFAVIVLSTPEKNPYTSLAMSIARRHAGQSLSGEADPGFFALSDPTVLRDCFELAGFSGVVVEAVPTLRRFPSVDAALQDRRDSLPEVAEVLQGVSDDVRQQVWLEITEMVRSFETAHGVTVPGELLLAGGTK